MVGLSFSDVRLVMRLFIAIDLDDDARAAVGAEQKRLAAALRGTSRSSIRWVRPDHMHLTLVFLGEVEAARAEALIEETRRDVAFAPFDLVFAGAGVFPPRGAPNVIWIGVTAGVETAIALQTELAQRAARHGVALETRPFRPHLTVGRWRDSRSADRDCVLAAGDRVVTSLHVDHATLYQSHLSPAGPSYTALARANLSAV
jgi:RNA 2',3'-cyclic 3'-phosphodiesterase